MCAVLKLGENIGELHIGLVQHHRCRSRAFGRLDSSLADGDAGLAPLEPRPGNRRRVANRPDALCQQGLVVELDAVGCLVLDAYTQIEVGLSLFRPFRFGTVYTGTGDPVENAQAAREAIDFDPGEPVRDICGLLESNGVKLLLLDKKSDSFFGLSVGAEDGGPAVVVNTWERISVERWIFTAVHELGHLLLHPTEYRREADAFASHFLMPEAAFASEWRETRGHPLLVRVLKVKRIFRVSYKTVLYRLVESGRESPDIWRAFQRQHREYFGKTLRRAEEPEALQRSEFAWNWSRSGEPEGLSRHDFVEDRLSRLVRQAPEQELISLGRAAEILGLTREEMRRQAREWVG